MEFSGHSPGRKSRSFGRRCNPWLNLGFGGSSFRAIWDQSAIELYKVADKGDPAALAQLRALGDKGDATAQSALGFLYSKGDGVPKDLVQAVFWYRKSAEQGNAVAQNSLGAMYENGNGVPKDLVIAYMWKNLAAYQGYETAKRAREALGKIMTSAQIAEAQRLSYEVIL